MRTIIEDGLAIVDDVRVGDGGEDTDFIEGVFSLLFPHLTNLNLLHGVALVVIDPPDLVDCAKGALTEFMFDNEII